jgi:putative phosphoesterase
MSDTDVVTLGLLSDTHFQDRLFELPARLPAIFAGVGLILHAGDVGEISVLDDLSRIAPVVAVHGNDEPVYVKQWLPYQQLVTVHGLRILLCHTHYPDPAEERAKRTGPWGPKLDRIAGMGRSVGARVVVCGHTHVPLVYRCDHVTVVNPGALASGNYFSRQASASVARLQVFDDGRFAVIHLDMATGDPAAFPTPDPTEEFGVLAHTYQVPIAEPGLLPDLAALGQIQIPYDDVRAVVRAIVPLYRRCLSAGTLMLRQDLVAAIQAGQAISEHDRARVLAVIDNRSQ